MANIKTSKGNLEYNKVLPPLHPKIEKEAAIENMHILQVYLDKVGVSWGPAFGTLIGIVRNDDFLPQATSLDFYILKEDEERFKDVLWLLQEEGFLLVRYERRGLYCLVRRGVWASFYILRKISTEIRHSGGTHFLLDKYLRNTVKWNFKGVELNVPEQLDEYLTFQYGDWIHLVESKDAMQKKSIEIVERFKLRIKDSLPDSLYYPLILHHHQKDFAKFKNRCLSNGMEIPDEVELSYLKPRTHKKVLTVGVYDLLHKGHIELVRRAKGLGDYLIVAVQDGDLILKFKPQAKVMYSTEDRMYMVKAIRYVDEVVVYGAVDEFIKTVDFDLFVCGPDQAHAGFKNAIEWCEKNGKEFMILGRTDGVSSSELKAKIADKLKI